MIGPCIRAVSPLADEANVNSKKVNETAYFDLDQDLYAFYFFASITSLDIPAQDIHFVIVVHSSGFHVTIFCFVFRKPIKSTSKWVE